MSRDDRAGLDPTSSIPRLPAPRMLGTRPPAAASSRHNSSMNATIAQPRLRRHPLARRSPARTANPVTGRARRRRGGHREEHQGDRGSAVSDAAGGQRRGRDPSVGSEVRSAAGWRTGHGQDLGPVPFPLKRPRGSRRGADRDRPEVRALADLSAHDPARVRQAGVVSRPRSPGVRDEPAAADRRSAARDRGGAGCREHRRRAPGHQRESDLPVLAPLPVSRGDRRTSVRGSGGAPREARGRLHAAAARPRRLPGAGRRGVRDGARPRPDRRVLPLRAARRSADERRARG
jgi:hypothetical protein